MTPTVASLLNQEPEERPYNVSVADMLLWWLNGRTVKKLMVCCLQLEADESIRLDMNKSLLNYVSMKQS